jgi:hypothetical protein
MTNGPWRASTRSKVSEMSATIKTAFATVIAAFLFLNPLGACTAIFERAPAPVHDCCPAPTKTDCEKAICVCTSPEASQTAVQPTADSGDVTALPSAHVTLPPFRDGAENALNSPLSSAGRYLSLHQFRI